MLDDRERADKHLYQIPQRGCKIQSVAPRWRNVAGDICELRYNYD
jgi:hypothetical protein